MIDFSADFYDSFLGAVRKYMQLRGGLTQKDLSEMTGIGISTMSRFLNQKTSAIDEHLVANIIAVLQIPLYEVVDGIAEDSTDKFKKLVEFYKEQRSADKPIERENTGPQESITQTKATINVGTKKLNMPFGEQPMPKKKEEVGLREKLISLSPRQKRYIEDFLDLDMADRDLIVDLGDTVLRYFRQRNVDF